HDAEAVNAVAVAEERELVHDPLGALAPEGHRGAVQPAEGAVRALAPPAPARRLREQGRHDARDRALGSLLEERVEIRGRYVVEDGDTGRGRGLRAPASAGPGDARDPVDPCPGRARREHGWERLIRLAREGEVDEGEAPEERDAHGLLPVRP